MTSRLAPLPACLACLTILTCVACGGGDTRRPVPRPDAYPRLNLPDRSYAFSDTGVKSLNLNKSVSIDTERRGESLWITLSYPGFHEGRFYLTLTTGEADMASAINNRMERIGLNTAGLQSTQTELTSSNGWRCIEVETPGSLTTPVQILAAKGDSLLSGTFFLELPPSTATDSVAPAADLAAADMLELLKAL